MAAKDTGAGGGATAPHSFFDLGEIRSAKESDFDYFLHLCDSDEGWVHKGTEKGGLEIWNRDMGMGLKMLKIRGELTDVSGETTFDVLMDGPYRKTWDDVMLQDYEPCRLDDNNDIGYYLMKFPPGLKNRDFVSQRSFRARPGEWITFNHSVIYEPIPPKKEYIRGHTYINGYLARSKGEGCALTYLSHADPRGWIPKWALNLLVTQVAPSIFAHLYTAVSKYGEWKMHNSPDHKPWVYPEQNTTPLIDPKLLQKGSAVPVVLGEEGKGELEGVEDSEEIPEEILKALKEDMATAKT